MRPRLLDLTSDPDVLDRFWSKVHKTEGCWLWTAATNGSGYGKFCLRKPWTMDAHRVAYQIVYGPVGQAVVICHRCDVPSCVRPDHLFVGTHAINVQDMVTKGRHARGAALNRPSQVGQSNYMARLTDDDVRTIRARYEGGDKPTVIAKEFGIKYGTVWAITHGHRWRHVT